MRFAEAVKRTLRAELQRNPKVLVFGEDVGVKGGVHLVTEGLQKQFGAGRVFDTSLSEEGIIGRAVGMAVAGLMPVAEIQFRKYADPAHEQLNNCGTMRWRTANRFCAPIVVRMPGGYGKDVGDPWHSLSAEVTWAHAIGWQVAIPSNAADAVGLLRSAMREPEPDDLLRASFAAHDERRERALSGRRLRRPVRRRDARARGHGHHGGVVGRDGPSVRGSGGAVSAIASICFDLRTVAPWDRDAVLESVRRTSRCLIVHEDTLTAGFGAEIAAVVAREAFWYLDAPVDRLAVEDVPMPYHPSLLEAVLPDADRIAARIDALLGA